MRDTRVEASRTIMRELGCDGRRALEILGVPADMRPAYLELLRG